MTKIQWTDATWNPVRGCSRVSEGCRNCYAEKIAARFSTHANQNGDEAGGVFAGFAEMRNGEPHWTGRVELIPEKLDEPLHWKKPRRVFVNSMSDLFHERLADADIDLIFAVMAHCSVEWNRCLSKSCDHDLCDESSLQRRSPHTFQILTKRPERAREYLSAPERRDEILEAWGGVGWYFDSPPINSSEWPLPNVWLGVSVEDQATADERIPLLLQTPAAVRFVSYEPALGPVDLGRWTLGDSLRHLSWVIVGGESGTGARPFNLEWAREVVALCKIAGVACFVKQLGARPMMNRDGEYAASLPSERVQRLHLTDRKGGDPSEWPEDLRVREFPSLAPLLAEEGR